MNDAPFVMPLLAYGIFYFAATAIFLAVLDWLYRARREGADAGPLWRTVRVWSVRSFAALTVASLVLGLIRGFWAYGLLALVPETAILLLLAAGYIKTRSLEGIGPADALRLLFCRELLCIAGVTLTCLGAWILTLGTGWLVYILSGLFRAGFAEAVRDAVVVTGLLWVLTVGGLYRQVVKKQETEGLELAQRLKFHMLLGPLVLACLLMIAPLLVEAIVNSPKLHEALEAGPRLQRV